MVMLDDVGLLLMTQLLEKVTGILSMVVQLEEVVGLLSMVELEKVGVLMMVVKLEEEGGRNHIQDGLQMLREESHLMKSS
jgi:hypothetical protein